MRHLTQPQHGMSLVELVICIAIAAIIVTTCIPAMIDYVLNGRIRNAGEVLLAQAQLARAESLKRDGRVQMAVVGNSIEVVDASTTPPTPLHRHALPEGVVLGGDSTLVFGSEGRPTPWGTEYSVTVRGPSANCGSGVHCAVLRVYAGGAVKFCFDGSQCS